jgi:Cysteine-rich secretory protein family
MHRMFQLWRGLPLLLLGLLALMVTPLHAAGNRYFPETGFIVDGDILAAFDRYGGVPVIGLPISGAMETTCEGQACEVQWFERSRIEIHHQHGQAYRGRIGADFLATRDTPWQSGSGAGGASCQVFAETGHAICDIFLDGWRRYGGLERLGLPLSSVQDETYLDDGIGRMVTYRTQWFERAALEDHGAQGIMLRLLGSQTYPTWAERLLADLINAERVKAGLPTLIWEDRLAEVARGHSQDLAQHNLRGHDSSDGRTAGDRLTAVPLRGTWTGEIVDYDQSPTQSLSSFLQSPGHRAILLDPKPTHLGVGYGVMLGPVRGGQWPATVWTVDFWAMH